MLEREGLLVACMKERQALQPGTVWLHGGPGPLREAMCCWCGDAGRLRVARAPSRDTRSLHRAPLDTAAEMPFLETPWRQRTPSFPHLGV